MSEPETTMPPENANLQFDRAEFDQPGTAGAACKACQRAIPGSYYEINGLVTCPDCKTNIENALRGGSGARRFLKALGLGLLAGAAGSGLWYAVTAATGYEIGLIAIVVGVLVGKAVRHGSEARGGWLYQALAMLIAYAAIVCTYIPPMYTAIKKSHEQEQASAAQEEPATRPANKKDDGRNPFVKAVQFCVALVLLFGLACVVPFLAGAKNLIGLLIIGFAVYEAWAINKRLVFHITGPYQMSAAAQPPPVPPAG